MWYFSRSLYSIPLSGTQPALLGPPCVRAPPSEVSLQSSCAPLSCTLRPMAARVLACAALAVLPSLAAAYNRGDTIKVVSSHVGPVNNRELGRGFGRPQLCPLLGKSARRRGCADDPRVAAATLFEHAREPRVRHVCARALCCARVCQLRVRECRGGYALSRNSS